MKDFLVSYSHLGEDYVIELKGGSEEDTKLRLSSLLETGKVMGELVADLPAHRPANLTPLQSPKPDL